MPDSSTSYEIWTWTRMETCTQVRLIPTIGFKSLSSKSERNRLLTRLIVQQHLVKTGGQLMNHMMNDTRRIAKRGARGLELLGGIDTSGRRTILEPVENWGFRLILV